MHMGGTRTLQMGCQCRSMKIVCVVLEIKLQMKGYRYNT
jgi:hypothetical protein